MKIQDHEICGDMGPYGAKCFQMLSDKSREIKKPDWDMERIGQLCMTADAFANIKTALLKLCKQTKSCTWEEIQTIRELGARIEGFEKSMAGLQ